jgi:hypothetical protein
MSRSIWCRFLTDKEIANLEKTAPIRAILVKRIFELFGIKEKQNQIKIREICLIMDQTDPEQHECEWNLYTEIAVFSPIVHKLHKLHIPIKIQTEETAIYRPAEFPLALEFERNRWKNNLPLYEYLSTEKLRQMIKLRGEVKKIDTTEKTRGTIEELWRNL